MVNFPAALELVVEMIYSSPRRATFGLGGRDIGPQFPRP